MSGGSHSPNLGLLDQEVFMQNIDRLVEALEMIAKESRMSKRRKLFLDEPSNSALQVYQPLDSKEPSSSALQVYQPLERSIVPSFPNFGITLKELSMLSRDEVFPYVNTHKFKIDGIVKISSGLFQPTRSNTSTTSKYIMDLSATGMRKLVDFLIKGECHRIVPPSKVEVEFLKRTGRKQATDQHEPLLLEARNAFTNTRVEWDNEKGELVREREALKEELNKAKEMAVEAEQHTEVV
ncbi:hypothetical protein R1flu_011380 [Riccia fluitans]|uniref:Uncharacterized protein n=1 Tax=Riccia fluitans TaxID=41844 RepID=A0ABD1Z7U4_9MARC